MPNFGGRHTNKRVDPISVIRAHGGHPRLAVSTCQGARGLTVVATGGMAVAIFGGNVIFGDRGAITQQVCSLAAANTNSGMPSIHLTRKWGCLVPPIFSWPPCNSLSLCLPCQCGGSTSCFWNPDRKWAPPFEPPSIGGDGGAHMSTQGMRWVSLIAVGISISCSGIVRCVPHRQQYT